MRLNINTAAVVSYTNKLEKMHRSALPVAIRGALNSAAFDVKQKTMPFTAKAEFEQRNRTFFKANSRVVMAKGFNTKTMKSLVGFTENKLKGGDNFAVKDLAQQEHGGKIDKKSFIPTDEARGGSATKAVRPMNRLSRINKVVNASKSSGGSLKQRFLKAAIRAGKGGHVLGNFPNQKLYKITSIQKRAGKLKIRTKALYSFKPGRSVRVKATHFMRTASLMSGNKIDQFFIKEATRQFERLRR